MELREILGLYYDSQSNKIREAVKTASATLRLVPEKTNYGILYKAFVSVEGGTTSEVCLRYGSTRMTGHLNAAIPFFSVRYLNHFSTDQFEESFELIATCGHQTVTMNSKKDFDITDILRHFRTTDQHELFVGLKISRTYSKEAREQAISRVSNDLTPKEYFAKTLNPSGDSSKCHNTNAIKYDAFAYASIKRCLMNITSAEKRSFICEYLYGVKVPKNCTMLRLFEQVLPIPYNDFGISDAKVLRSLIQTLSSSRRNGIRTLKEQLIEIGIKPATDLKRWPNLIKTEQLAQ